MPTSNINGSLREKVIRNVLNRKNWFTTNQVSKVTKVSTRHTRRVLSELVSEGFLTVVSNGVYTNVNMR